MSLFIRPMSDLHLEMGGVFDLAQLNTDKDTVLVLAGDIGLAKRPNTTYKEFIERVSLRLKHVVYVLGNHEFYKSHFTTAHAKIWNALLDFENVSVLDKESIVIDGVAFIGATLWTDMDNCNVMTVETAKSGMNDYNHIRVGPDNEPWQRKLHPHDTVGEHVTAKQFIMSEIVKQKQDGNKVVVVSHHGCSYQSINIKHKTSPFNGAYVSELAYQIMDLEENQPDFWIHGHVHDSIEYNIDRTKVIVNPRGYYDSEINNNFNPNMVIEV